MSPMAKAVRLSDYIAAASLAVRREWVRSTHILAPYRMLRLRGPLPDTVAFSIPDLRQGDPAKGSGVLDGRFVFVGDTLDVPADGDPWTQTVPSRDFAAHLHSFVWLRDLLACEETDAESRAGELVDLWIATFGSWNGFAWNPETLSSRVLSWLAHGETLFDNRTDRLYCLVRQVRHLSHVCHLAPEGVARLRAAATLFHASCVLDGFEAERARAATLLDAEVSQQVLADGGHISRAPETTANVLITLVAVQKTAEKAGRTLPDSIQKAVDRLGPAVRFFSMGDSSLANFHGGGEGDRRAINAALSQSAAPKRTFGFAPHSGYHRVDSGGATLLLDSALGAKGTHGAQAHASALAFEFSAPGGRVVVNCGWCQDQPRNWRHAVRATAAHSTLTLEETSSSRFLAPGWQRQLLGARFSGMPNNVSARRNEEEIGVWLEGSHDGYRESFGLSHRRRVFLAADGGDLRGEDALFRPADDGPPEDPDTHFRFAIRFHLHPGVRASLSRDAMSALLVLPTGDGWRFRTDGGPVRLERSVYLASGAQPQRTTQIVIHGEAEPYGAGERPPNRVRWAFQRLGRVGHATGKA
jgi:uncharacterized heparinase superfamily protein